MPSFPFRNCLPDRRRLPALLVVLLAVALVAGSGWLVYDDFRPDYQLRVSHADSVPHDSDVLDFEALPPESKTAFEQAQKGGHTVHSEPAWLDTFPLYETVYVRLDGDVYEAFARSDGLRGFSLFVAGPAILLALGLGFVGARSYRRENVRTPLTVLAVFGAVAAVSLAWPFRGNVIVVGIGVGPAKVAVVAAVAAVVGTRAALDRYDVA